MNEIQNQTARAIASVNNAARVVHSLAAPVAATVGVELPNPTPGQTVPEALTAFAQTLSDVADIYNEFSAQVVQAPARVVEGRLRPALEDKSEEPATEAEEPVAQPVVVQLGTVLEDLPEVPTEAPQEVGANGASPRRRRGRGQGGRGN